MVWIMGARYVLSIKVVGGYLCRTILSDEETLPGQSGWQTTADYTDWPNATDCTMWLSCRTPRQQGIPTEAIVDPLA
jgi:hypothetical protein